MTNFEIALENVKENIFSDPLVVSFFKTRDDIDNCKELQDIINELHTHQKAMSINMNDSEIYNKEKMLYETSLNKYSNHPLIINYNYLKNEVYNFLSQIVDALNSH
jgi:hypothetical protein